MLPDSAFPLIKVLTPNRKLSRFINLIIETLTALVHSLTELHCDASVLFKIANAPFFKRWLLIHLGLNAPVNIVCALNIKLVSLSSGALLAHDHSAS